ncbi:MAG: hypothetical protein IPM39_16445 [Chloroflexi bacterium]|nr:hypothetical protein [Chloroflexota bacterium]
MPGGKKRANDKAAAGGERPFPVGGAFRLTIGPELVEGLAIDDWRMTIDN